MRKPQIDYLKDAEVFAQNVRKLRQLRRMNQEELAKKAGINLTTMNQIENIGSELGRAPLLSTLSSVAKALEVPISSLFVGGTEDRKGYLHFSAWAWSKFLDVSDSLNLVKILNDENLLRRQFEGFLVFLRPGQTFSPEDKELIWMDRLNFGDEKDGTSEKATSPPSSGS